MCVWCAARKRRKKCHWNGNRRRNRAEFLPRRALHVSDTPITWIQAAAMNHRGDHGPLMELRNHCESWASASGRWCTFIFPSKPVWEDKWRKNEGWQEESENLEVVFQQAADWHFFMQAMFNSYNRVHENTHPASSCVWQASLCVHTMLSWVQRGSGYPEMLSCWDISPPCRCILSYLRLRSRISVHAGRRELMLPWKTHNMSYVSTHNRLNCRKRANVKMNSF